MHCILSRIKDRAHTELSPDRPTLRMTDGDTPGKGGAGGGGGIGTKSPARFGQIIHQTINGYVRQTTFLIEMLGKLYRDACHTVSGFWRIEFLLLCYTEVKTNQYFTRANTSAIAASKTNAAFF